MSARAIPGDIFAPHYRRITDAPLSTVWPPVRVCPFAPAKWPCQRVIGHLKPALTIVSPPIAEADDSRRLVFQSRDGEKEVPRVIEILINRRAREAADEKMMGGGR